ncbi:hypothetical protein FHG87_021991 [Trinorchestia longiramus]|nr:hypothetical protein FHG87_021991 [Trinorchestia longiramus]
MSEGIDHRGHSNGIFYGHRQENWSPEPAERGEEITTQELWSPAAAAAVTAAVTTAKVTIAAAATAAAATAAAVRGGSA